MRVKDLKALTTVNQLITIYDEKEHKLLPTSGDDYLSHVRERKIKRVEAIKNSLMIIV